MRHNHEWHSDVIRRARDCGDEFASTHFGYLWEILHVYGNFHINTRKRELTLIDDVTKNIT